ncbi:MAG: SAM-dependent methyltransferase, partial [Nitrososphaeraceae archaeon]|nr:SAM-dependent methyltransferase [Nitrososphaeraceae archaeon]
MNNRYPAVYTIYYKTDNDEFNNAQHIIREKYKTPFKYKSISTAFNLHYSFIYPSIKKKNYKNIAIFDNAIDNLEIMLYYSNVYDAKFHIDYNYLYLIEEEKGMSKFDELKNKLSKYYDTKSYNIIINKSDICSTDTSINKKYDLIIFGYVVYEYGKKFHEREIIHFSNIITVLKILSNGGDYIFKLRGFSQNYIKQVIYLLLKYFKNVSFIKSKLYSGNLYIKCENYFNIINDTEYAILIDLLKKWDKINPNCGDNLNFSKKELRDLYYIKVPFDKKHVNKYVTNLFDFDYSSNFNEKFNAFFENYNDKLKKMKACDQIIEKTTHELDANQLVEYYDKNYKNNYGRLIEFSKDYKLPLKPEVITSAKKYQQKILRETVSIESSVDIILKDYNKNFVFSVPSYKYKDYTYNFSNLLKTKYELNLHKIAIDSREIKYYNEVTEKINIPRYITAYIQSNYHIKVTRAFIKMFELLNEYKLIDLSKDNIKTFHTCEAPGHFINATNYYIKLHNKSMKYDWYANSLNPYNQENKKKYGNNIFGDAYGFMRKYKERWLWGKDDTGDITNVENIKEYHKKFNYSVDLFTSDCGLGAISKSDFFDQEKRLSILNFAQCLIALLVLRIGGNAVFKV